MLKLVKYEFRKALPAFLVLVGILIVLEGLFLCSIWTYNDDLDLNLLTICIVLLVFSAYVAALFVLIRGIMSYSRELSRKSSYLLFMTPNPCWKIVGSKFLYTFFNGLLFAALYALAAALDVHLFVQKFDEYGVFVSGAVNLLSGYGVYVTQILYGVLFVVLYAFLALLATTGLAYLSVTTSFTLFRDRKWRWLPSLILFWLLMYAYSEICAQLPSALDHMVMVNFADAILGAEADVQTAANTMQDIIIPSLLPTAGVSLAAIVLSWLGCSVMLEKKVSL